MLQSHLAKAKTKTKTNNDSASTPHVVGMCSPYTNTKATKLWILDSGASSNICCCKELFTSLHSISIVIISLLDHRQVGVSFSGDKSWFNTSECALYTWFLVQPSFNQCLNCKCANYSPILCWQLCNTGQVSLKMISKARFWYDLYVLQVEKPLL